MCRSHSDDDSDDRSLVERAQHDLLNPISSILGLGETIRAHGAELGDATLRSLGDSIARQAARLEKMLRDLARATRLLREPVTAEVGDVVVQDLVASLAQDRVRAEVPAGLTMRGDAAFLEDVLRRLIDNALEYSSDEVVITAGPGFIEVTDAGPGFSEDGLAASFEPLRAGTNTRNERGPGVGLGLFIARALVEAQGGTLTARSAGGQGATFRIELPN